MKYRTRGFTLIEMHLALALTSLLTASISMMVGQAALQREAMRGQHHDPAWATQLINIIERDLRQAQWWAGAEDRIVLVGLGRDGIPAKIEYQWSDQEDSSVLIRTSLHLTEGPNQSDLSDTGVLGFDLQSFWVGSHGFGSSISDSEPPAANPPVSKNQPKLLIQGKTVPLQPLPNRLTIQFTSSDATWAGLIREVVLR